MFRQRVVAAARLLFDSAEPETATEPENVLLSETDDDARWQKVWKLLGRGEDEV